jgi:hypothetical protein
VLSLAHRVLSMENEHESLINFTSCLLNDCREQEEEEDDRSSFGRRVDLDGAAISP